MADHLDEPPQKRVKMEPGTLGSDITHFDIFGLEDNLPDELVSTSNSWPDPVGNKLPSAQGPGPGGPQLNGEDTGVPNVTLRQIQQQQLHHLMQQQGNKNALVGNTLNMGQLGSKSPNLQSPPNLQGNMPNSMGGGGMVNSMPMSISNNGTQTISSMQQAGMNSIAQGNIGNMIITNSNMGNVANAMAGGGLVGNTLKQQIGGGPIMGPGVQGNQGNPGLHHAGHQGGIQNGPMMNAVGLNVGRLVSQQHMVRPPNPHLMGTGPRMQTPNIPLGQINSMGGPNGPYGYGGPNQQGVNVVNTSVQQPMLVNTISQQRVPPNIVMQGNRPGGPIGANIGLGGVGGDTGIAGQGQPPSQASVQPQSVAPSVAQPRPQVATQQNPNNPLQQAQQQQQNPGGAQPQPNQSVNAGNDKKRQIQQQLMLLLHAHKCTRRENENPNNSAKCTVVHCKTMRDVLTHMASCKANRECTVPHCTSSRQILTHYKNCDRQDCMICITFRQADKYRKPNVNNSGPAPGTQANSNVNMVTSTAVGVVSPANINAKSTQDMSQMQNAPQNQDLRRFDTLGMQGPVSSAPNILPTNTAAPQVTQGMRMTAPSVRVIVPSQGVPQNANQALSNNIVIGNDMNNSNNAPSLPGAPVHVVSLGNQQTNQQPGMSTQQSSVVGTQPNQPPQSQANIPQSVNVQMFNTNNTDASKTLTGNQLSQMKMGVLSTGGQLPTATSVNSKDWHHSVTTDLRNHLVHKLVQAIFPTSDPSTMMDKRMHNLVSYAEKVERDMFEMANSRSEYYHLLAEKIYKIQKELEEKRQKRKEQQLMQQQQQQQQQTQQPNPQTGGPSPQPLSGHQQIRPIGQPAGMVVSPMGNAQSVGPGNAMGTVMPRTAGPNLIGQGGQQAGMRSHSPSMVNVGLQQNRMQFPGQQTSLSNLLVNQPGPSPNGTAAPQQNMVVQNPVLSPFTGQVMSSNSGMTPPTNAANQFISANGSTVGLDTAVQNQINDMMKARIAGLQNASNQQQQQQQSQSQQQQPPQMQQQQQQQQTPSQVVSSAQNVVTRQAPSPFSSAGQIQNSTANAFNTNLTSRNNTLPSTPTTLDALSGVTNSMVPVPSPSPSLSSNGPIPVSTPNPPSVSSLIQPSAEPTPPPSMSSPSQTANAITTPSGTPNLCQSGSLGKGGGNSNSVSLPPSRPSSSSNLSSQMAALEAAIRDRDENTPSPPPVADTSGPQKGKLDSIKDEDDIKKELDDGENSQLESSLGGKNVNNENMSGIKTEAKTEMNSEIKNEPMDIDGFGTGIKEEMKNKDDIKIKDEPMSPSQVDSKNAVKTDVKPVVPEPIQPNALDKKKKCLFKPEELRQALMPTLEKLFRQDPESIPFRQPVDPQALGIPDYFEIVKKPMDLSTIRHKLNSGQYADPWEYVDDVWLMFDNAWLYNRKTSRVYRYCTKLSEVFEQEIDPVMQALGYCCGRKYTFNPQVLCCYGKQLCTIPRDAKYYSYQNSLKAYGVVSDRYTFCQKCFNDIPGDTVTLGDDPMQSQTQIKKDQFKEMKNDHLELEPFVDCLDCGRKQHQICVLYLDTIWAGGFVCDNCLMKKSVKRKENKFNAKRLPTTKLGIYIETRVNNFLKKKEAGAGEVHIRVVSSSDKVVEVKQGMRRRFVETGELPAEFPYRAKALFAFEEVDGVDVCFFGMHVQEYGSECPAPNTRRVYIAYLDSVHFFRPRQYRTAVYHEILLGYMDYVKQLGYTMAHIWACPPSEGDDYIFHCHPPDQKIPKPKRLQEWYKKMLDKGMIERTIQDYKDILKQAMEDKLTSAAELPYFEGDFWPNVLEESIKELDQEEEEKRKQAEAAEAAANAIFINEDNDASGDGKKKGQKKAKKSNKSKAAQRKNNKKSNEQQTGNDLSTKIYATMEKHKEVFFVIRLHSAQSAASLAPIQDPDPLMNCDLMDGRDAFLTMARDKHFEFSSLRRAQFSTLCMLYELHNQGQDKFVYTCNNCKTAVETRYHCTVCDDFDLCCICKEKVGHPHKLEKLGFDLDDGSSPADMKQANPQEARKQSIQRCIQSLVHACQCRDANCRLPSCQKMKRVVQHTKNCKRKTNGGCPICKQLIALCCYHAKHCQESKCPVPFCSNIKHKLKQQQLQQRLQQAQLLRRRMAVMNTRTAPTNPGLPTTGVPSLPAGPQVPPNPGAGGVSPSSNASPASSIGGMTSPHQPGIGLKPGTQTPPANVLQVVKQVQEEAARQQVPHGGGFGKVTPPGPPMAPPVMQRHMGVVPNQQQATGVPMGGPGTSGNHMTMEPWGNRFPNNANQPGLRPPAQNQMIQPNPLQQQGMMTMVSSGSNQIMGANMRPASQAPMGQNLSLNPQQLTQIMQKIKSHDDQQKFLQVLKSNPQVMAAIIKQRQQSQNAGAANQGGAPQQTGHLQHMMGQQQQQQVVLPNQASHTRMPAMQNTMMGQGGANIQQQSPGGQNTQMWYKQQQIMRQLQMNYPAPPYPQRPRAPQMGAFPSGGFTPDQQYAMQQGLKPSNPQQAGGIMPPTQIVQGQPNQNVMGPPTPHSMQQQLMQSVRSPPPIRSPQPTPSPRSAASPRAQPSASPRAQPSPHHLSSHSPAPQPGGPDLHNHMHPHQSPIPGGLTDNIGPGGDAPQLNAQDQLTKFVEQL